MSLMKLSLKEISDLIKRGEVSPVTLVVENLKSVRESNLNAFITVCEEEAIKRAEESLDRIVSGNARPLEGVPIGIKDIFCTNGIKTTAGSRMLENFVPRYESTVTQRLLDQGAIFVGKNNMDEFAMGSTNRSSYFGSVKNPIDERLVPGGSSGGGAAAVAGNLCYAALGSDTGGSVRQPAAFCGIVGVKLSYGICSRFGMIAYASSMDQPGVMARSVEDACIILDVIKGHCKMDSMSANIKLPLLTDLQSDVKGMRIGYIAEHMGIVNEHIRDAWKKSLDALKARGAEIVEIQISDLSCKSIDQICNPAHSWLAIYYALSTVEAMSNLARYDGIRYGSYTEGETLDQSYMNTRDNFGPEVQRRLALGAYIMSTEPENRFFSRSIRYRDFVKERFARAFRQVDCILSPTSPHVAFPLDEYKDNSIESYTEDVFTVVANLIGSPAISVPVARHEGLPIGMQIMTKKLDDAKMIVIAKALEKEIRFE